MVVERGKNVNSMRVARAMDNNLVFFIGRIPLLSIIVGERKKKADNEAIGFNEAHVNKKPWFLWVYLPWMTHGNLH
jgi:hypothetical protein